MPMFEGRTYEAVLAEMLAAAPKGVDTRQGSIYYDAVAACAFKLARFYVDLDCTLDLVFIDTATGEYLDRKGTEFRVVRNPATCARYAFTYEGTRPQAGTRWFSDGRYFVLAEDGGTLYLDAEEGGTADNAVEEGTPATPVNSIAGLAAAKFGALLEPGTGQEEDEDFRERIREKIAGPAQNGNKQHYKTWCEEVPGVGRARVLPLWAGENTVKGVLLGPDGQPAPDAVVDRVQEHVDPGGLGLGEGAANIGAHFTAAAASRLDLQVNFTAVLATGYTAEQATEAATQAVTDYLKDLALSASDKEPAVLRVSSVGAILYALAPIIDYADLTLNGEAGNIEVGVEQVAVLEGVTVNVAVR